jgi:hypothetical protein
VRLSALSRLPVTGVKCTLALGYLSEMSKVSSESLILAVFLIAETYYDYCSIYLHFFIYLGLFLFPSQVNDATVRSFLALSVRGQNDGQKAAQVDHLLACYTRLHNLDVISIHVVVTVSFYDILYLIICVLYPFHQSIQLHSLVWLRIFNISFFTMQ